MRGEERRKGKSEGRRKGRKGNGRGYVKEEEEGE